MITCQTFRAELRPNTTDPELLAHLRTCDSCLDHAVDVDPGNFFRLLGGDEMVPPGGVDAFASDVMTQVRLRSAETSLHSHQGMAWPRRLAVAATVTAAVTGAALVYHVQRLTPFAPAAGKAVPMARVQAPSSNLATKPVIETYESKSATFVEVPSDGANVVMIVDDSLPADL